MTKPSPDPVPLTVLIVDDNSQDRQTFKRILNQAGTYHVHEAATAQDAFIQLQNHPPDIILLDYTLPDMTGLEFLATLRGDRDQLPLPVIMITGHGNETVAVTAIKQGCQDYLIKGGITPTALNRAILNAVHHHNLIQLQKKVAQQTQQQEILQKSTQFLNLAIDTLPMNIAILDETGTILQVNRPWKVFADENQWNDPTYGVGQNYIDICQQALQLGERDVEPVLNAFAAVIEGTEETFALEYPCHSPTTKRWFMMHLNRFEHEGQVFVMVTHQNITARVLAEQQTTYQAMVLQNVADAVISTDLTFRIVLWNKGAEQLYQWKSAEVTGKRLNELLDTQPLESFDSTIRDAMETLFQTHRWQGVLSQRRKDGRRLYIQSTMTIMTDHLRKQIGITVINRDITLQKQMELVLIEKEQELSRLLENLPGMAYRCQNNPNWTMDFVSQGCFPLTGYDPGDLVDDRIIAFGDLIHPADRTRVWETVQTALQNHRPFEIEYRLIHKDGTERWVSERGIGTISPEDGQIWLEGIIIDITTQKQAEFQRRELETIINRSPVVVFLWENAEGWPVTYVSGSLNQWGYTPEAFYNRQINFAQIVHPDDLARVAVEVAQYSEEGRQEFTQHYRIRTASGEVRYVEDCTWVRRNEQNEITHYQGILLDITEQVKAEQRYQTIFETAGTALTILDETGLIRLANTEFSNLAGLPLNQIINKTRWQDFVAPDEIERMTHYQDERRRGSENVPDAYEFKFQDAAGNIKHILTRVKMIPDSSYSVASLMNFTSRKHAEEKLAWLAAVVQQATFSVVVTDLEGQIEYVNPYFEKITGYCPAEVIGENPRLLKSGKHDKSFYQQLWDTITQGNIWTGRFCNKRKDGTLYYEDAVIFPIRNSKGQMINYAGVKRDITEQVKAEEQLHFLANILENVQDSVIVTDLEQRILYWNNGAETILGYSAQEMLGQSIRQIHGGQVRIWGGDFENLMAGNDFINEWEVQRKDGTTIWLDTKTTLMFDETGQPTGFINVAKDITVRKLAEIELQHAHDTLETRVEERTQELANVIQQMEQEMQDRLRAEEELVESNEKFRQLAENVDTVFWIWDIELGMLIYVNPAYEQIWGRPLTSLLVNSTFWTEQVHPADQERVMEAFTAFYDQNIELEYRILRPDNESRWVWVRTFRIPDPVGNIYRIIGLVEDITPQKEAEEALRQALEKEKELNNLKTRFISTVSHEYRTPLAVIQMSTGILKRYRHRLSPEKQDEHIHRIEGQIKQMTNLLDNVLFIGRSDTGRLEFKPAPFDLKAFIANLLTDFGYVYENRQIDFICTAKSIELTADQQLVGYVLRNLISNALKYSPAEKPVQIELQAQPDQVVLRVVDQGIGIPAADQSHLFGLFYRATNVTNIQGTGLGLNIAKRAVEMHGGTIAFTSTEGEGTTFTVTLPYTPPA